MNKDYKDYKAPLMVLLSLTAIVAVFLPWSINMQVIDTCNSFNPSKLGRYQAKEGVLGDGQYYCHFSE